MPKQDKTGPQGAGPMTGRGMGVCDGATARVYARRGIGMGRGMRGCGCGCGYGRGNAVTKEQEIQMVKQEIEDMKKYLDELEK